MPTLWDAYSQSERLLIGLGQPLGVTVVERYIVCHDHPAPARGASYYLRTANAIRTNDCILDTPTIDAACGGVESVCSNIQIIEGFTYQ